MLAGKYRLGGDYYIKRAKEQGKLYQFSNFGIAVYERKKKTAKQPIRFAFVISTKIAKHAVDRIRIKRMMSEAIRFESKHLVNGLDVVFLVKPSITGQPTDVVMKETQEALVSTGLINSE